MRRLSVDNTMRSAGGRRVGPSETWDLTSWPPVTRQIVDPDQETAVAAERLYWRDSGKLAYPAGAIYPVADIDRLIGETDHFAVLSGGAEQPEPEPAAQLWAEQSRDRRGRRHREYR